MRTSSEWCDRGHQLRRQEEYSSAIVSYDRSIALDANYYQAWCGRGMALEALGDYEHALASYGRSSQTIRLLNSIEITYSGKLVVLTK